MSTTGNRKPQRKYHIPNFRKVQTATPVLIVHRRVGRKRIATIWGFKYWGTLCNSNRDHVNVSTKWEEVTCMRCLEKGGYRTRVPIKHKYEESKPKVIERKGRWRRMNWTFIRNLRRKNE